MEGIYRLQGLLCEEAMSMEQQGDAPSEAGGEAVNDVLAIAYTTYHALCLHTSAALRSAVLAIPKSLQSRIYKLLIAGLCTPQREVLLESRLVRDSAEMALQALVDAQRNGGCRGGGCEAVGAGGREGGEGVCFFWGGVGGR